MIKPINITQLDTTNTLEYKCDKCGKAGTLILNGSIINVDRKGNPKESLEDYECPECGSKL